MFLLNELRNASRVLARAPVFTGVVVLTLALGLGATTTVFSVVDGTLLEPLPYAAPARLARVYEESKTYPRFPIATANFLDLRAQASSLATAAVFTRADAELSVREHPERLRGMRVSGGFFELLGRPVLLGRGIERRDEEPGREPVVVLGYDAWQRLFDGRAAAVGESVVLDGTPHTVVGVAAAGLEHVGGDYHSYPQGTHIEVWRPFTLDAAKANRYAHFLNAIARVGAGASMANAQAELDGVSARLAEAFPDSFGGSRFRLVPLTEDVVGGSRRLVWVLFGAVAMLLLLTCVNVANLLLARSRERVSEMAIRQALGAGRGRIVRQLVVESILLGLAGGVSGVGLAAVLLGMLRRLAGDQLPRIGSVALDGSVIAVALAAALLTGLLFGAAPAWRLARLSLRAGVESRKTGRGRGRLALVAVELALATMLLVGAGLLLRSLDLLQQVDPGFEPELTLTGSLALPLARYPDAEEIAGFWLELGKRLRALPGVVAAGAGSDLPWNGWDENLGFYAEGSPGEVAGDSRRARYHQVTPDYFAALGTTLLAGRELRDEDGTEEGAGPAVVVNRRLVERAWPELGGDVERALGRRITYSSQPKPKDWGVIVGVVESIRDTPEDASLVPGIYYPLPFWPENRMFAVVRTAGLDPETVADQVRRVVADLDPELPLVDVAGMERVVAARYARPRLASSLLGAFAGLALLVATFGLGSVIAFTVAARRREVALRLAIGATSARVTVELLRDGATAIALGLLAGISASLLLSRALRGLLYGIDPTDPLTLGLAAGALAAAAVLATAIPAYRGSRLAPAAVLRSE